MVRTVAARLDGSRWLAPAAWLFRLVVAGRELYFASGPGTSRRLPLPTIVVGNLSVGGTGKTSMVSNLTGRLLTRGLRPAVLSRGYARPRRGKQLVIVSRGEGATVTWETAGDEPFLLARRHPGAIVIAGPDRVRAGHQARELGADVLILDDAFQYRRVRADFAILMVNADRLPWNDHLLPRGRLREPTRAAGRADVIVEVERAASTREEGLPRRAARATVANDADAREVVWGRRGVHGVRVWRGTHAVVAARRRGQERREPPTALRGRKALLFSGIGNPDAFAASARSVGVEVVGQCVYRDHHGFTARDLRAVEAEAERRGADLLLTTEKDEVRLGAACDSEWELWSLEVCLSLVGGDDQLDRVLENALRLRPQRASRGGSTGADV